MPPDLFDRRSGLALTAADRPTDPAFAARPRLLALRDALVRAAKHFKPARWNEPAVFFFDPTRQAELEAARPPAPDRFAELTAGVGAELPELLEHVEVRRVARAIDGLKAAALALAPHCPAANDLADLLAVPDDEIFLALAPRERTGVRLHVRGAASVGQLFRFLEEATPLPERKGEKEPSESNRASAARELFLPLPFREGDRGVRSSDFQLFLPSALRPDGTLPTGPSGCGHWLWPTQPLSVVPRVGGERVVLVGPAVIRGAADPEIRFPAMRAEAELVQTLNAFQVAEALARLTGRPVPVAAPAEVPAVARAA